MYIITAFFVEFDGNGEDNNENIYIDTQTGLLLKDDGRHKAVQSIIVIRQLPPKQFVQKGFIWKDNGAHKVLKRIIVLC